MRLRLELTANRESVPFDYQHYLIGAFHKWIGAENAVHDSISLYSLSWLQGGQAAKGALQFPRGAEWLISFHDERLAETIANGALRDPEVCCGMRVRQIEQEAAPPFGSRCHFRVGSPVLARQQTADGKIKHLLYTDPESDDVLTQTLHHKMDAARLDPAHKRTRVRFDRTYRGAKTRLVTIKNIQSRASSCPVYLEGTPEGIEFAWNVGVGHSTGSGFGCLLHTGDERKRRE